MLMRRAKFHDAAHTLIAVEYLEGDAAAGGTNRPFRSSAH